MGRVDSKGRSGIHLTGEDSGWPVANADDDLEPEPKRDGSGTDDLTKEEAREIDGTGSVRTTLADSGTSS